MTEQKRIAPDLEVKQRIVEAINTLAAPTGHKLKTQASVGSYSYLCLVLPGGREMELVGDCLRVREAHSGDTWHRHASGKVTVTVQRGYRAVWTRTLENWTDKYINLAAEIAWKTMLEVSRELDLKAKDRAAESRWNVVVTNLPDKDAPGVQSVNARPTGIEIKLVVDEETARAVLALLKYGE
jgi:hypothetical protein